MPGIRFAAAGQQGSDGLAWGGLAWSGEDVGDRGRHYDTSAMRGLSAWNRRPDGHGYASMLASKMHFYGDNPSGDSFGEWGMGMIENPDLSFSSAGIPSVSRAGMAGLDDVDFDLRRELGMPGVPYGGDVALDVRMSKQSEYGLEGLADSGRELHNIRRELGMPGSPGGEYEPFDVRMAGLGNAISDSFLSPILDAGAWPATGGGGVTDLMASLPPDQQNTVATLVKSGMQLVDAVYRVTTGGSSLLPTRVAAAAPSSASSIMPIALLGIGAFVLLRAKGKGSRRRRRRR